MTKPPIPLFLVVLYVLFILIMISLFLGNTPVLMAKKTTIDLVDVDVSRFKDAIKGYFLWKELDTLIRTSHTRGINIPETVTETLLCYVSDLKLNKGSSGDAFNEKTNQSNFEAKLVIDDIKNVEVDDIPDFDIMLAGFPCQAFSLAGYRKGFNDERGNLFFELVRIFEIKKPKVIFLENVKNLVGHDKGNTFRVILDCLKQNGYSVKYQVLNACDYGNVPQNRERIYIVAFLDEEVARKFTFPEPILLTTKLSDVIDFENKKDDKYYYTEESCKFYNELKESINKEDTIYQWRRVYVRENKNNVCPTLTANMGTGGHNVPLIYTKHGIRKLTPRECFNVQGFSKDFIMPADLSNTRLYKQAGNSVTVTVIERIAKEIIKAFK